MGLRLVDAVLIAKTCEFLKQKETVVTLGMLKVSFNVQQFIKESKKYNFEINLEYANSIDNKNALTQEQFFKMLNFKQILAMDYSDYEGAQIVHDLNNSKLPKKYYEVADFIFDGGTIEHVFNIPAALEVCHLLLKEGGIQAHHLPSNGYLDHGFYQLCPTLFTDYYRANGYKQINASNITTDMRGKFSVLPYTEDIYRNNSFEDIINKYKKSSIYMAAQKIKGSTANKVPTQSYYQSIYSGKRFEIKSSFGLKTDLYTSGFIKRLILPFAKNTLFKWNKKIA